MIQRTVRLLACLLVVVLLAACGERKETGLENKTANGLVLDAYKHKDYPLLLSIADSLNKARAISETQAYYWSGYASDRMGKKRTAEYYWKKALSEVKDFGNNEEVSYYAKTASHLANLLNLKGDYDGSLKEAINAAEKLEELGGDTTTDYVNLLVFIGCGQARFPRMEDASKKSFERAYEKHLERINASPTESTYKGAIAGVVNMAYSCNATHQYQEAQYWCERYEELVNQYERIYPTDEDYIDKQHARHNIYRATALASQGKTQDSYLAYLDFRNTKFSKSPEGIYDAGEYLIEAKQWNEAAKCFERLDELVNKYHMEFSFENIETYYLKKYESNLKAGRKDSVYAISTYICDSLSAAIDRSRADNAAELATIYETEQKETQIVENEAKLLRERQIAAIITIILIVGFFIAYALYKQKAAAKLHKAHNDLKIAYDQLEETTSAKERIESELRIARHIQESMVPTEFPQRDDFELYASTTAAKEVGGDLYDYLIIGDSLCFCVGDVSGKGVPAALFMAQVIRLFRAMVKRNYTPAKIATELNAELVENNDDGMFITMFIGVVHLPTGKLEFCNAGHNPPVIGNGNESHFIDMEPNAPIGLWEGLKYQGEVIDDIRGRLFFVYTDGLNEAENPELEQFGDEQLLSVVKRTSNLSAREMIKTMKNEVKHHRNGADPSDDLTMLCLHVN